MEPLDDSRGADQLKSDVFSSLLLGFMRDEDAPLWKGYFYATLMFLLSCLQSLFNHQYMYTCFTVGMRVKTAVMGLVYRKVGESADLQT